MENAPVGEPMYFGDAASAQQELSNFGINSVIKSDLNLGTSHEAIHRLLVDSHNFPKADEILKKMEISSTESAEKPRNKGLWSAKAFIASIMTLVVVNRIGSKKLSLIAGLAVYLLVLLFIE